MQKTNQILNNPFPYSDTNKRYYTYDYYMRKTFGRKCTKIPLDAGFTCPNIDGTKGYGGCTYCSDKGSGDFCEDSSLPIKEQFMRQYEKIQSKWKDALAFPYFQAHTNTYASIDVLREKYEEALSIPNIGGLYIATRADAISNETAKYLHEIAKRTHLVVELGLQTVHDKTAERINRCHGFSEFLEGYNKLAGIDVCIHIINGLPGEDREMMLETARVVGSLHPKFIKIHLMHIIEGTKDAEAFKRGEFRALTLFEYVDVTVSQLEIIPSDIVIERVTGDGKKETLLAPLWSLKKFVVMNEIDKEFIKRNSWQGRLA